MEIKKLIPDTIKYAGMALLIGAAAGCGVKNKPINLNQLPATEAPAIVSTEKPQTQKEDTTTLESITEEDIQHAESLGLTTPGIYPDRKLNLKVVDQKPEYVIHNNYPLTKQTLEGADKLKEILEGMENNGYLSFGQQGTEKGLPGVHVFSDENPEFSVSLRKMKKLDYDLYGVTIDLDPEANTYQYSETQTRDLADFVKRYTKSAGAGAIAAGPEGAAAATVFTGVYDLTGASIDFLFGDDKNDQIQPNYTTMESTQVGEGFEDDFPSQVLAIKYGLKKGSDDKFSNTLVAIPYKTDENQGVCLLNLDNERTTIDYDKDNNDVRVTAIDPKGNYLTQSLAEIVQTAAGAGAVRALWHDISMDEDDNGYKSKDDGTNGDGKVGGGQIGGDEIGNANNYTTY